MDFDLIKVFHFKSYSQVIVNSKCVHVMIGYDMKVGGCVVMQNVYVIFNVKMKVVW